MLQLQRCEGDAEAEAAALRAVQQALAGQKLPDQVGTATKDLHSAVSRLGRVCAVLVCRFVGLPICCAAAGTGQEFGSAQRTLDARAMWQRSGWQIADTADPASASSREPGACNSNCSCSCTVMQASAGLGATLSRMHGPTPAIDRAAHKLHMSMLLLRCQQQTNPVSLQALDKAFVSDICKAPVSDTEMDQAVLDRVIAAHLFQQVCAWAT